jgi:hypothetical protein
MPKLRGTIVDKIVFNAVNCCCWSLVYEETWSLKYFSAGKPLCGGGSPSMFTSTTKLVERSSRRSTVAKEKALGSKALGDWVQGGLAANHGVVTKKIYHLNVVGWC